MTILELIEKLMRYEKVLGSDTKVASVACNPDPNITELSKAAVITSLGIIIGESSLDSKSYCLLIGSQDAIDELSVPEKPGTEH